MKMRKMLKKNVGKLFSISKLILKINSYNIEIINNSENDSKITRR